VAQTVKADKEKIEVDRDLSEFGFDSIAIMSLTNQLNEAYGLELSPSIFFEFTFDAAFQNIWSRKNARRWSASTGTVTIENQ